MKRWQRTSVGGGLGLLLVTTVGFVYVSTRPDDSPARAAVSIDSRSPGTAATRPPASPSTTAALASDRCPEPSPPPPPSANGGALREVLLAQFPDQFGGMYLNPDGTQTVLHVGDPKGIDGFLRQRGVLSGPLAPVSVS